MYIKALFSSWFNQLIIINFFIYCFFEQQYSILSREKPGTSYVTYTDINTYIQGDSKVFIHRDYFNGSAVSVLLDWSPWSRVVAFEVPRPHPT
jgi:hypothetical protein